MNRLGSVLSIPPSTLSRRKREGHLDRDESERAFRLARLVDRAAEMTGSLEGGVRWLKASQYALGGQTPLDYADTEVGARVVEDLIGRIEHGIPA
jgi:putative toxin-antitoxin system antitoxin component (TIGR02293 family)